MTGLQIIDSFRLIFDGKAITVKLQLYVCIENKILQV